MSKELSAEWQQKIRRKANDYLEHRFDGQFPITTPGIMDDSPVTHFAAGYSACVIELIEAQERIKDLENYMRNIIRAAGAADYWGAKRIANEALSPVSHKKKENE